MSVSESLKDARPDRLRDIVKVHREAFHNAEDDSIADALVAAADKIKGAVE